MSSLVAPSAAMSPAMRRTTVRTRSEARADGRYARSSSRVNWSHARGAARCPSPDDRVSCDVRYTSPDVSERSYTRPLADHARLYKVNEHEQIADARYSCITTDQVCLHRHLRCQVDGNMPASLRRRCARPSRGTTVGSGSDRRMCVDHTAAACIHSPRGRVSACTVAFARRCAANTRARRLCYFASGVARTESHTASAGFGR